MRKFFLGFFSIIFLVVPLSVRAEVEVLSQFPDVRWDHPHAPAIQWIKDHGIVQGYEDGTFRPDETISRAEFTKILIKMVYDERAISSCTTTRKFPDIVVGSWEEIYICVAYESGLINGFEDGSFRPWAPVSLYEAYKILAGISGWEARYTDPWWIGYQELFTTTASDLTTTDGKLTRGGMAEFLSEFRSLSGKFITFETQNIELMAEYTGAEKVTLTHYPEGTNMPGMVVEVWGTKDGENISLYQEKVKDLGTPDGILLGWVDNGVGVKAVVVISTYSGMGTKTSWFALAASEGTIVKFDPSSVKQGVLDEHGYQDRGYNAVSVIGNDIAEIVPGNAKEDPSLHILYRFTGEGIEVVSGEVDVGME